MNLLRKHELVKIATFVHKGKRRPWVWPTREKNAIFYFCGRQKNLLRFYNWNCQFHWSKLNRIWLVKVLCEFGQVNAFQFHK